MKEESDVEEFLDDVAPKKYPTTSPAINMTKTNIAIVSRERTIWFLLIFETTTNQKDKLRLHDGSINKES